MYKRIRVDSVYYVTKTLFYLRPKTCDLMPNEGKQLHSHKKFKLKIKMEFLKNVYSGHVKYPNIK